MIGTGYRSNPKAEIRNPKEIRRPKPRSSLNHEIREIREKGEVPVWFAYSAYFVVKIFSRLSRRVCG
jgi:hypothetical protein